MNNLVPADWSIKSISDIATVGSSKRILQSEYVERGVPFFRSKEAILRSKKIPISSPLYISRERFDEIKARFGAPIKDEILITAVGTIGVIYLIEDIEFYFKDGNLLWIRKVDSRVSSSYLAKYLASDVFQESITRITSGSSQAALTIEKLSELEFNLPPLPEQQKIAAILTSVDEVIEKTQAQIDKLKDLKTAMMQELLSPREDSSQGNGVGTKPASADTALNNRTACRESYIPHTEFKDSPVGRVPKSWEVVTLSEITSLITKGATPTTSGHSYALEGTRFYRSVNASENGELLLDDIRYISSEADKQLKRSSLAKGDVVLSIVGAKSGKTYFFVDETSPLPANINQNIALIRPNRKRLYPEFLKFFMSSDTFLQQLDREITTQAQPSLSLKQVGDFKTQLPSLDEQIKIAQYMSSITKHLIAKYKKITKLKNTKKALMQDLLTGKVRVKVD